MLLLIVSCLLRGGNSCVRAPCPAFGQPVVRLCLLHSTASIRPVDRCGDSSAAVLSEDRAEDAVRVWAILENDERKTGEQINVSKTGELTDSAPTAPRHRAWAVDAMCLLPGREWADEALEGTEDLALLMRMGETETGTN